MLVLTRKTGQKLIIADNIEITVLETKGDAVKIGIQAPRSVSVYREEIYQEIKRTNQQATTIPDSVNLEGVLDLLGNSSQQMKRPSEKCSGRDDNEAKISKNEEFM